MPTQDLGVNSLPSRTVSSSPRPRPRPSRSLGSRLKSGIRSIGSRIKSDFQEIRDNAGKPRSEQTQAYRDKTEKTRDAHNAAVARRKKRRKKRRAREQAAEVATPEVVQPDQQTNQAMLNRMRMQQEQAARAANMNRARMMFERQNMRSPGPVPRQMQGLGGFRNPFSHRLHMRRQEQPAQDDGYRGDGTNFGRVAPQYRRRQPAQDGGYQRTVGQLISGPRYGGMPRMPMPQPMPRNQATSPAFRYAGQNYDRLGGMQRTMPRPMEMMSRGERQQIGRMADRMERPSFGLFQNQNPYVGILQRGISAKGGGRTMPQRPPSRFGGPGKGRSQTMSQQSPFAAMLASRFGGSQGTF